MAEIVLATLNARYAHASFGLRYLLANLGELRPRAALVEFDLTAGSTEVIEAVLSHRPRVVGFGVYVWNVAPLTRVVEELKRVAPEVAVVVGGPEVSHEVEDQAVCRAADYVVTGEADRAFADLCRLLLAGDRPAGKVIAAPLPGMGELALPYEEYTQEDIAHRVIYVEASRGCPFRCEFCLSSLDVPVRAVEAGRFLEAMDRLVRRGVRRFKFVDRTFNLDIRVSRAILEFFLDRMGIDAAGPGVGGLFLHLEMIPDRLPEALREVIARFPPGSLQLEVGVQTFDAEVARRISRRQDPVKVEEHLRWLRERTHAHVHADLIVGLPGEDEAGFAAGFDRLWRLGPHEIQVGLLKRLRGTPIARHDARWGMVYSPHPPYEVLRTGAIDFAAMQRMRRFARCWDMLANSGNFPATLSLVLPGAEHPGGSCYVSWMRLSGWLHRQVGRTHSIALARQEALLERYLVEELGVASDLAARQVELDREHRRRARSIASTPARQSRHVRAAASPS